MTYHGTNQGWVSGCRELCCQRGRSSYLKNFDRLRRARGERSLMDREEVRLHLEKLAKLGLGPKPLSELTGIPSSTLRKCRTPPGHASDKIFRRTGDKILSVPLRRAFFWELSGEHDQVDAHGTVRRIEGLFWMGYTKKDVLALLGRHNPTSRLRVVERGGDSTVDAGFARAIKSLTDTLILKPLPQTRVAEKSREYYRSRGCLPLGAWSNIDDPYCVPDK